MKKVLKKFRIMGCIASFMILCNSTPIALAKNISNTGQVDLLEYVYDENNRLVEVKRAGETIAILNYDKNGNLLSIHIVK